MFTLRFPLVAISSVKNNSQSEKGFSCLGPSPPSFLSSTTLSQEILFPKMVFFPVFSSAIIISRQAETSFSIQRAFASFFCSCPSLEKMKCVLLRSFFSHTKTIRKETKGPQTMQAAFGGPIRRSLFLSVSFSPEGASFSPSSFLFLLCPGETVMVS